nr:tryptophyllin 13 [Pithecopus rohdei]prf//1208379L tryptophyllin 13 [Pithecopus rohdei]
EEKPYWPPPIYPM